MIYSRIIDEERKLEELVKWQKRTFWIRFILLSLILMALIYVGWRGFDDPCNRCKLKVDSLGGEEYTCRQLINLTIAPILKTSQTSKYEDINLTKLNELGKDN